SSQPAAYVTTRTSQACARSTVSSTLQSLLAQAIERNNVLTLRYLRRSNFWQSMSSSDYRGRHCEMPSTGPPGKPEIHLPARGKRQRAKYLVARDTPDTFVTFVCRGRLTFPL